MPIWRMLMMVALTLSITTAYGQISSSNSLLDSELRGFEYNHSVGSSRIAGGNGLFATGSTLYFIQIDKNKVVYIKHPNEQMLPSLIISIDYSKDTLTNTAIYWNTSRYSTMTYTISSLNSNFDRLILRHCDSIVELIDCDSIIIRTKDGARDSIHVALLDGKTDNVPIARLQYPHIQYLPKSIVRRGSTIEFTRELKDDLEITGILEMFKIPDDFEVIDNEEVNNILSQQFSRSPNDVINEIIEEIQKSRRNK